MDIDQLLAIAPACFAILALTIVVSGLGLMVSPKIVERNLLRPYYLVRDQRYDTLITKGFVHADFFHLLFNMMTLYFIGPYLEGTIGTTKFVALYFLGLVVASLGTFLRRRRDPNYASLGASGAINSVLFAFIVYYPTTMIRIFFAIPVPASLFAVLYLAYSYYSARQSHDNVNHDAHFDGAIFGLLFVLVTDPGAWGNALAELTGRAD
ncbi:MAG TPA: rhomboid family intramembrane serine protease [Steroidobacteraceae bacterium]|nr:rhomboid family intramembrane serine protease [Steroidobacteraceae bacterium]